jgi:hypothetical protein
MEVIKRGPRNDKGADANELKDSWVRNRGNYKLKRNEFKGYPAGTPVTIEGNPKDFGPEGFLRSGVMTRAIELKKLSSG